MQSQTAHPIYEFGDFELDSLRRVLVSRVEGQPVDITGRVLDALIFFLERPGQLVEKKALFDALWPHVVVEEGNLTQTIHSLRRVLGEKSGEHRYIATVPGRGYRFVAEVKVRTGPDRPAPVPARRAKTLFAAVALALTLLVVAGVFVWKARDTPADATAAESAPQAQPSIAVLAFVDMSEQRDQAHFAEGLSEEILNLLAQSDSLRVIARTSSFSFKDQNADIGTIAKRLSVTHVLEGSVRKAGQRVRITAQLIDAATSAHLWSDTYDRDLRDIFGVQSEIATAVASAMHVTLRRSGPIPAETSNTQAYDHFLQGRHLFNRRSGDDVLMAKSHFEKAIQLDPDYGRAWAALAGAYLVAKYEGIDLPDVMQNWRASVERAVTLAPDLAEAHVRAAQYYWHTSDNDRGLEHFKRAQALDPADPLLLGFLVSDAIVKGRLEDAVQLQQRVVAIDPLSATNRGNLGVMLMVIGRLSEAQTELERSLELSPTAASSKINFADVLLLQGRTDEALKVIVHMPESAAKDQRLAITYFLQGAVGESDATLARMLKQAESPTLDPTLAIGLAEVYAARNEPDRAFTWIHAARRRLQERPELWPPFWIQENLRVSPFLKPLQADPRWRELVDTGK